MESNFIEEISRKSNELNGAGGIGHEDEAITLEQIALLTDFPEDFIKKELLLGKEQISMKQFREKVLVYLESTIKLLED